MKREEAKAILPILNAFADGKVIQVRTPNGNWRDRAHDLNLLTLIEHPEWYRIKPEAKYRPFKNTEEFWQEMQKHQPFGWVKIDEGCYYSIVSVSRIDAVLANCSGDLFTQRSVRCSGCATTVMSRKRKTRV